MTLINRMTTPTTATVTIDIDDVPPARVSPDSGPLGLAVITKD